MNIWNTFPSTCDLLRNHPSPGLRAEYLQRLEKIPATDERILRLKRKAARVEPLKSLLANRNPDGWWYANFAGGMYKKYQGTSWSLLFAAELGAPPNHASLRSSCEYFLDRCYMPEEGAFSNFARRSSLIPCFAAHACYFLTYFGFGRDERVENCFRWLAGRLGPDNGMRCFVMDPCLNPECIMVLPKFLKAAALLGARKRRALLGDAPDHALRKLLEIHLDRYQPVETTEWARLIYGKGMKEIRRIRKSFKTSGKFREKPSWMRFQFPLHYDSDLIEVLLCFKRLRYKKYPVLAEGARRVYEKFEKGRVRPGRSLRGKLWADVRNEDDWITLRALEVLGAYG